MSNDNATLRHPDPATWWKHLRRGMYTGIWGTFLQTLMWIVLEVWHEGLVSNMGPVISWSYGTCVLLIISYSCVSAVEKMVENWKR